MLFKYLSQQEARELSEAGVPVFNRYRNADRSSRWDQNWSDWKLVKDWDEVDWGYVATGWEDEYRVEVE